MPSFPERVQCVSTRLLRGTERVDAFANWKSAEAGKLASKIRLDIMFRASSFLGNIPGAFFGSSLDKMRGDPLKFR